MERKYLVLGGAQLGMDDDVLGAFKTLAKSYALDVIHIGHICTEEEHKMYRNRLGKLRT